MALIDSLVSYWRLDEASGDALDAHGSNTLTETSGTIDAATGKVNGGRDFEEGDTEWFEKADNSDLSTGDIDFSIACWVNLESKASAKQIFGKDDFSSSREYGLAYSSSSDRFVFTVTHNGSTTAVAMANNLGSPSTGTWYFIVCWHDSVGNVIGISVNAGTPDTTAHSLGVFDGTTPFRLGANGAPTGYMDGIIDEVGFWKRVLTSQERTDLYNGGSGLAYPFSSGSAGGPVLQGRVLSPGRIFGGSALVC